MAKSITLQKLQTINFCLQEAMLEVDIDDSGTVDFFEFLCVARLISQGKGKSINIHVARKRDIELTPWDAFQSNIKYLFSVF